MDTEAKAKVVLNIDTAQMREELNKLEQQVERILEKTEIIKKIMAGGN